MAATITVRIEDEVYDGVPVQVPDLVTSPASSAAPTVDGDAFNPLGPVVENVTANNVVTQAPPQLRSTVDVYV